VRMLFWVVFKWNLAFLLFLFRKISHSRSMTFLRLQVLTLSLPFLASNTPSSRLCSLSLSITTDCLNRSYSIHYHNNKQHKMSLKRINKVSYNRVCHVWNGIRFGTIDGAAQLRNEARGCICRVGEWCLSLVSARGVGRGRRDDSVWNAWWIIERGIALQ
jgi:hypothetical protein